MENNYQAAIESLINNKYGIPKEAITGAVRKYASLQGWSIQSPQFHNFIEKMYKECNGDESEFFKKIYDLTYKKLYNLKNVLRFVEILPLAKW